MKNEAKLTKRQIQIIRLVAQGLTDEQVAEALGIETVTAATHLTRIKKKLWLSNRVYVAIFALKAGLITLDEIPIRGYDNQESENSEVSSD